MFKRFKGKGEAILLFLLFTSFYIFLQTKSIYGGDSGDLVTAVFLGGIPHPPGYPLYSLLGYLASRMLPFYTPAWRVGLLSSLSAALCLTFFYLFIKKTTKHSWSSLLSTLTLAFIYPFWLSAETAEVFALNNLLIVLLIYLTNNWLQEKKKKQKKRLLYVLALIWGLAFAHHHLVVLLVPGLIYIFYKIYRKEIYKKNKNKNARTGLFTSLLREKKLVLTIILFFIAGFSFYLYPLLACRKNPIVCWDNPVNFKNLFHLMVRADYGTFKVGANLGNTPLFRAYSLWAFVRLFLADFSWIGAAFFLLGFLSFLLGHRPAGQKDKSLFYFLSINLFVALFFIFYASFLILNSFMMATFERFLLLPYILISCFLGLGVDFVFIQLSKGLEKVKLSLVAKKTALVGFKLVLFILPLSLLLNNFKKIYALKNNFSAEQLIKNFMDSLPQDSILVMSSDTTFFNALYLRYVLGYRPDITVLGYHLMPASYYQEMIKHNFPQIQVSAKKDSLENFKEFVSLNNPRFPIFCDAYTFKPQEDWLVHGLALEYKPGADEKEIEKYIKLNQEIWGQLKEPADPQSLEFKNLFLADIFRIYYHARINFGELLLKQNQFVEAEKVFNQAVQINPDDQEAYMGLGIAAFYQKKCQKAEEMFLKVVNINKDNGLALGYLRRNALECFGDEEAAGSFEQQCLTVQEDKRTQLEE